MGLFPETFLKRCGGVTGLGTHISPNHLLERGYGGSTCTCSNISPDTNDITSTLGGYRMGTTLAPADSMYFTYEAAM